MRIWKGVVPGVGVGSRSELGARRTGMLRGFGVQGSERAAQLRQCSRGLAARSQREISQARGRV